MDSLSCLPPSFVALQVVFSGEVAGCADHMAGLGAVLPPNHGVAVPDWLLDTVIRSPRALVIELVDAYRASR